MSLGYAEKLSYRDDLGGQLGAPELFDEAEQLIANAQQLADMVISSVHSQGLSINNASDCLFKVV